MRRFQITAQRIVSIGTVWCVVTLTQAQLPLLRDYRPPHLPTGTMGEFEDLDGDGDPDVLRGRTAAGVPFQWIDDDDDMTLTDRAGDSDSDCLMIDRNRDGQYGSFEDLIVDWNDEDGDGVADLQTIVENAKPSDTTHGPGHYMIVVDTDHDGVFNYVDWHDFKLKCWEHSGLSHFFEDYLGTSLFLKIHSQTANLKDLRFSWENPFLFYDEDGDGVSEKAIRLCDSFKILKAPTEDFALPADGRTITDEQRRFEFTQRINWASIAQDLDNDSLPGNEFDFDMTLHFHGPGFDYSDQVHKYSSLRGLPGSEKFFYDPRWRQIDELIYPDHESAWDLIFQRGEWTRCWFVFDEDDDCQRWERVELYEPRDVFKTGVRKGGLDQNPQADSSGDRGEWDDDCSGKGKLYISRFDGRIHLFGAEWGAWRIDQDAHFFQGWSRSRNTAEKFATIKYSDTNKNGFLDQIAYDIDGDHVFERTVSLLELGLDDTCETVDPSGMRYADFQALHKRAVEGIWQRAQAALQVARDNQLDIAPYAKLFNPGSLREKYDYGYWLNFYLYHDLRDLALHYGDQEFLAQLERAFFSGDWSLLSKRLDVTKVVNHFDGPVMPMRAVPEELNNSLSADRLRIYRVVERQAHYLLGTLHPWSEDASLLLLTDSKSGEHWIRPNTNTVAGLAFLYKFGPYDEQLVGLSRDALLADKIIPMMRYLISTHITGQRPTSDGQPWGDHWQSALWAHMLGRGAWWIWDDLPADVQVGVRRVIAHEADRIASMDPPFRIENDTKAEENAWDSLVLSVAVLLMPEHPRRESWEPAFYRWALSSFLRPADATSDTLVDGQPISSRFLGANLRDDFTLENHNIVHPDYMNTFNMTVGCMMDYRFTNRQPLEALTYNAAGIYENLKWFQLPDGGFLYPSGQDWRLFRNPDWVYPQILMAVFCHDPDAWGYVLRGLETLEKMQARSESGAIYLPEEYFFASTQHDRIYQMALAWLALDGVEQLSDHIDERLGVKRMDAGKILINRTPNAVHAISWGRRMMLQCIPYRQDRLVSPDFRSWVGAIRLAGESKALPISVSDFRLNTEKDTFEAHFVYYHGDQQIRAELSCNSHPDGRLAVREQLIAMQDLKTARIKTGLIGVLNNPHWIYEDGDRLIAIDGKETLVTALSGQTISAPGARHIVLDNVLAIRSEQPLNMLYVGAEKSTRARVTDECYLNVIDGEHAWKAGEVISDIQVEMQCLGK